VPKCWGGQVIYDIAVWALWAQRAVFIPVMSMLLESIVVSIASRKLC